MEAGKLRHQIIIQSKAISTDAYGGAVETWSQFGTPWAAVEPLSGRELVNAQAVYAETTTRITMRYLAGVLPSMRITFEGKYYNIQNIVDPELKHRELIILASEGLNEG